MEINTKALVIIVLIVVGLFAGGLYLVIQDSKNQAVTLEYTQELINSTNPQRKAALEMTIRNRISDRRPIAMTSKADFDSYDKLISMAYACDKLVKAELEKNTSEVIGSYHQLWTNCMKN